MRNVPIIQQAGYTLTELVIVVTILGIIAAIAMPATSSSTDKKLELAASEFAAAIRFARSESMRTGQPHGFRQQNPQKRIRVFSLDMNTSPATLIYDVYHPVEKQIYDYEVDKQSSAAADLLNRTTVFRGTCNQHGRVYFDINGTPRCADPSSILLEHYELQISLGTSSRRVTLDGITGRVTVQ